MKFLIIIFFWICPVASKAQLSFLNKTPLQLLLVNDNVTLDSLKIFPLDGNSTGDFTLHAFGYDDQLQKSWHDYRFFIDGVEYPSRYETFEYLTTKQLRTIQLEENGGFVNWSRQTMFPDPSIGEDVSLVEDWNDDSQLWINGYKYVRTFDSNDFLTDYFYAWDKDQMTFELMGKKELSVQGDTKMRTHYSYNSNQEFVLDRRLTEKFLYPEGIQILSHSERYENESWSTLSKYELVIDVPNLRGHQINTDHFDVVSGQVILSDSISFYLTDALQPKEARYYEWQTDGSFTFEGIRKYTYRVDGLIALEDYFTNTDTGLVFTEHSEYIYSEQDSIVPVSNIESRLELELIFANPMIDEDKIQVVSDGSAAFDFWLIDAQGKIIHQQSVKADDELSLAPLALSPGVYFMTLFGKQGGQKTWKMVKQ